MSSNSWLRILQTAPIVSALRGREPPRSRSAAVFSTAFVVLRAATATSALQVAELVLADLDLVRVLELVRLDAPPVDVRAVQRPEVVDVEAVLAPHDQRVIAGHGDVVEEHLGVRTAPDADPVALDREALARAAAAGANDERSAGLLDHLVDVNRLVFAGLVDLVGHRGRLLLALSPCEVGTALLTVVGALGVDEPALRAVHGHRYRASSASG